MPSQATIYKILIASPSDVVEERKIIPEIINSWNVINSDHYGIRLEPVLWETHATPDMGKRPQAIINKQLVETCDILVAIFWTRLGTHTGEAESGTLEEIQEFQKAGKPALLYFSLVDIPPENIDLDHVDQYRKLLVFKKQCEKEGLVTSYKSIEDLRQKLQMHLTQKINSIPKVPINVTNETHVSQREAKISAFEKPILKEPRSRSIIPFISGSVGGGGKGLLNTTALKTINPRVFDERKQPPIGSSHLPFYKWDVQNFDGFFYDLKDDIGKESLFILQPKLGANQRTIGENQLTYVTAAEPKRLKVVEEAFGHNAVDAANAGLELAAPGRAFENGQYLIIGWQGQKYVAINGKVNKLSKLIIEHGTSPGHEKTLAVGESWDIGDGWTITANSIDTKAIPKQVWLTLSKNGVKKDDKVVSENMRIYTFVERRLAGETDVPMFVTYVNNISEGTTTDIIQLKYTWAISSSVIEIKSSDTYGVFTVTSVLGKELVLMNSNTEINLIQNAIVNLMGNLKFKVADRADVLRFYPTVLP